MNNPSLPLEDIILPNTVSFWPLAWGWWLLIITSTAALSILVWWLFKRLKRKRKQQQAERLLLESTRGLTRTELFIAVNTWLKIQASATYPQAHSLYGDAWINFLNESAQHTVFSSEQARALSQGIYQPQATESSAACQPTELRKSALLWLKLSKALHGDSL